MATETSTTDDTRFSIVLHSTCEVSTRSLRLQAFPETVAELQRHVETEFSVPECCQSVIFEAVPLHRDDSLRVHRARNGDTFHVYYKSEADVKAIRVVVDSIQETLAIIEEAYSQYPDYYCPSKVFAREDVLRLIFLFDQHINPNVVECLANHYFQPSSSERSIANRLFFLDIGGLELLHKLLCAVLKYPWEVTVVTLQCLEHAILRVLWNITASFDIRLQVLQYPFIDLCMKSALRVPIKYKENVLSPEHLAFSSFRTPVTDQMQELVLGELMYKAFGVIFNLAELPQCQVRIASESTLLKQGVLLALSPSYKYIASLITAAGLVCLAYNAETHQYLVKQDILQCVMDAASFLRPLHGITQQEALQNRTLLRYFASLLFAQLLTSSLHLIERGLLPRICWTVHEFLTMADPKALHDREREYGYLWSTLRPHINLAYSPINAHLKNSPPELVIENVALGTMHMKTDTVSCIYYQKDYVVGGKTRRKCRVVYTIRLDKLFLQCIEVGVVSLQNMLFGEKICKVLQDEKLVDFVVCMPWFLPSGSRPQHRACDLVRSLATFMKLEPPSLVNIARAKLAADTFGLERTLNAYSIHDLIYT